MPSNWNLLMNRMAANRLSGREASVLAAIARKTLGYSKPCDQLSASQIARTCGLSRSHVAELLCRLESRGAIIRTNVAVGRSATISLNLDSPWEPVGRTGQVDLSGERDTSAPEPVGRKGTKPVGRKGHTRGKGVIQNQNPAHKTFQNLLADSYLNSGGNLDLDEWRGSLFRQGTALRKEGVSEQEIFDAARSLAHDRAFPGLLKQRVTELREQGGFCHWGGLNRSRLTAEQLSECGCGRCLEWLAALTVESAA